MTKDLEKKIDELLEQKRIVRQKNEEIEKLEEVITDLKR